MKDQQEAGITFYVAGCMEFTNLRECYENLTLQQAVDTYQKIKDRNKSFGCGIGFTLHDPQDTLYSGMEYPLYQYGQVAGDAIEMIPAYREHPLVQKAMADIEKLMKERQTGNRSQRQRNRGKRRGWNAELRKDTCERG